MFYCICQSIYLFIYLCVYPHIYLLVYLFIYLCIYQFISKSNVAQINTVMMMMMMMRMMMMMMMMMMIIMTYKFNYSTYFIMEEQRGKQNISICLQYQHFVSVFKVNIGATYLNNESLSYNAGFSRPYLKKFRFYTSCNCFPLLPLVDELARGERGLHFLTAAEE